MPRVRIVCPEADAMQGDGFYVSDAITGYGVQVFIDGQEIQHVRSIKVSPIEIDSLLTVTITVLASPGSEIDITAHKVDEVKVG